MQDQHHQEPGARRAPGGGPLRHPGGQPAPEPPGQQQLQGGQASGTAELRQPSQGSISWQHSATDTDPKQGPLGQQHLRQAPDRCCQNSGAQALGAEPLHQQAPSPHQHSSHYTQQQPQHQTQGQAQRQRHAHPVERVEPQQPAMADQHRCAPPKEGRSRPQRPQRHQGQPKQRRTAPWR